MRDGRPHRIVSGALHYFRVHEEQWADRIARLVALGVNTLDTYVAWNAHERTEGDVDFTGRSDLGRFLDLAADAGLDIVVRPGPYICAEWNNGGLPAWLTHRVQQPRSTEAAYLEATERWFDRLLPIVAERQATRGGRVVAVQVENEYGSYGDEAAFLRWNVDALRSRGIDTLLFTADGPTDLMLDGGTIDGVMAAATLGSRAAEAERLLRARRAGEPFFVAEFWCGWFDHRGERHHRRTPDSAAAELDAILERGSVSMYMAHGGTNFGLDAGANFDVVVQPTVTSYDYDAPIGEDGTTGEKFAAMREVILRHRGIEAPPLPPAPRFVAPQRVALRRLGGLDRLHRSAVVDDVRPRSFESLGLDAGLVRYTATTVLPEGATPLVIEGLRDRATVRIDGAMIETVERGDGAPVELTVHGEGRAVTLELLVRHLGRINYGGRLGESKGVGIVCVERRRVLGWRHEVVRLDTLEHDEAEVPPSDGAPGADGTPGAFEATVELDERADAWLGVEGAVEAFVWVNGFALGRLWAEGPQVTLYVPAPVLRPGANTVRVLDLEGAPVAVTLGPDADLGEVDFYGVEDVG
nr:beta-galactosidase family protein [Pseudoclavibacter chungangensis]